MRLTRHAQERMRQRGVTDEEVRQVLLHGRQVGARGPRRARELVFTQGYWWQGRRYPHKLVRVVYAMEDGTPVVVTVYAHYGRWRTAP